MISPREIVNHPAAAVSVVLGTLASLFQIPVIDAVFSVLWGQLSILFTGTSIFAFTVLPNVDLGAFSFLSENAQIVAVILGVFYGLKLLTQVGEKIVEEIE